VPGWLGADDWVVVLGVSNVQRAAEFWRQALGYNLRADGFAGWATVLTPPTGLPGAALAMQTSETPVPDYPRLHLDLHVTDAAEQAAEVARLVGWELSWSTGTATRRIRTSSYWPIRTGTGSASSDSAEQTIVETTSEFHLAPRRRD
jgi:hypothetical protein